MKTILCVKVSETNKSFLKQLSVEKQRSVSNIIDITVNDLRVMYERNKDNEYTR
jgi:hypothetical protein